MTEDQMLRIVIGGGLTGAITMLWPQIMKFLVKIGYRDKSTSKGR